jgi:UDP:flavonoid glycosyltransferase YjiC (YdhE family)
VSKNKSPFYRIRRAWRRLTPLVRYAAMTIRPVELVFVHHTAMPMPEGYARLLEMEFGHKDPERRKRARKEARKLERQMMTTIEEIALERGFDGISYTDIIFESGRVYMGRGFTKIGAHTLNYNSSAYGLSAAGNFSDEKVPNRMLEGYARTIAKGIKRRRIKKTFKVRPHSAVSATECPGDDLRRNLDEIAHRARRKAAS